MSETKGWAFLSEHGRERISAYKVKALRKEIAGRRLDIQFWSIHRAGNRKRLKHVIKQGTPYFSYMNGQSGGGDEGGVSLSHLLYQEAIAQLPSTELRLGKFGNHKVTILAAEIEKRLGPSAGGRVADVHLKFTSDTYLAKKWNGEVCIEVHHTHAVPGDKILDLRRAKVAVVEVNVSKAFAFPYDEDVTTEEREAKHVEFLVRNLGEFILGTVLSDPSSADFLQEQLVLTEQALAEANEHKVMQKKQIVALTEADQKHRELNASLAARLRSAESEVGSLKAAVNAANQEKKSAVAQAKSNIELLTDQLTLRTQVLVGVSAATILLLGILIRHAMR